MKTLKLLKIFYDAADRTVKDDGVEHAGYIAFLALLSFFPSLIFLLSVISHMGKQSFGADMLNEFYKLLPLDVMNTLAPTINEIMAGPPAGLLTLAIVGILWTASGGVEGVRTILNKVYRVSNPPHFLLRRLVSIFQFIVVMFILAVGTILIAVVPSISTLIEQKLSRKIDFTILFEMIRIFGSLFFMMMAVAVSYYILPNIKHSIVKVMPGAAVCVTIWIIVLKVFTYIIGHYTQINALYGSLAGIIVTLIFFYVMALIYIYCAEFNYLLEKAFGVKMVEKE